MRFDKNRFFFKLKTRMRKAATSESRCGSKISARGNYDVASVILEKNIFGFIECRIEWQASSWQPTAYKSAICCVRVYARVTAYLLISKPVYEYTCMQNIFATLDFISWWTPGLSCTVVDEKDIVRVNLNRRLNFSGIARAYDFYICLINKIRKNIFT